ncbi:MAG: hypothetical protein JNJ75_00650 [Cyclobacteriaceae bacterium]|nr:hypothetical protein [Cyclobacteriaceae bacterium]
MNAEPQSNARKENFLRKWGLENLFRQVIRSISTTLSQAIRELLRNLLSKK